MDACKSLISSWLNSVFFLGFSLRSCSAFFSRFDKSGMTYVIFKGTKTQRRIYSLFSAESRDHNPYLTPLSSFSRFLGNRTRVAFTVPCYFFHSFGVGKSVTSRFTSELRPDYR